MLRKKFLVLALVLGLTATGLHAQFSVGGGFIADFGWSGVTIDSASLWDPVANEGFFIEGGGSDILSLGFGGYVFVSGRFIELSMGFLGGPFEIEDNIAGEQLIVSGSFFAMDLTLLGRLPLTIGAVTIAPLLGIGWQAVLSGELEGIDIPEPGDLSNFRILLGLGSDIMITPNWFFRSALLAYYRLPTTLENNVVTLNQAIGLNANAYGGIGLQVRLGVGFRF
ncbi:MAG: hypothetical protein FWG66_10550 [Spirochaetes bacterium]|nr:hypothetical protein [Spirochaetota bacterium]